jgi:hypothetical protein
LKPSFQFFPLKTILPAKATSQQLLLAQIPVLEGLNWRQFIVFRRFWAFRVAETAVNHCFSLILGF